MSADEEEFRQAVRTLIARGTYPDHTAIRRALGLPTWANRSGLKGQETRWRLEEVKRAGYDWEASKRAQRLVKPTSPPTMLIGLDAGERGKPPPAQEGRTQA